MSTSTPQAFGGPWTHQKLDIFGGYLTPYRKIFDNGKASWYRTIYVDAFAGSGACVPSGGAEEAEIADSAQAIVDGSTRIALEHTPGFSEYLFVELKKKNCASLERLKAEYPHHNVRIERGDANDVLREFCRETDWKKNRAVVFLDPFGMQVEWDVVKALGATGAVDLWYLFPIGTLNRMLPRSGPPRTEWCDTLTRLLGTSDWQTAFYTEYVEENLFGFESRIGKCANWNSMSDFIIERLAKAFGKKEVLKPILLKNTTNTPLYALCFAASNDKGAEIANRIAKHLMKKGVVRGE